MQWSEVIENPLLRDLPFKIELNKFGKLLMSPASNNHGRIQSHLAAALLNQLPKGEVISECSIQTSDGVKVADVAWLSVAFVSEFGFVTPYLNYVLILFHHQTLKLKFKAKSIFIWQKAHRKSG